MEIVEFFLDVERNDMQYLLTNPYARNTEKKDRMTSAYIQASRKMWKTEGRDLTEKEKNIVIQNAERTYNKEVRQKRKAIVFNKVASVAL